MSRGIIPDVASLTHASSRRPKAVHSARPRLPPTWVVLVQKADESVTMRRLDQMKHLVDDDVLQQVAWLLDQFRIEPDVSVSVVTTSPLRLHALQEVTLHIHPQLRFPLPHVGWARLRVGRGDHGPKTLTARSAGSSRLVGLTPRPTESAEVVQYALVRNLLEGQHEDPVRIVAFNTAEGWSRDVTVEIADEVRRRFVEHDDAPASLIKFIEAANRH
jgi:hypothetical protein